MKHLIALLLFSAALSLVACSPGGGSSGENRGPHKTTVSCSETLLEGEPSVVAQSAYRMRQACGLSEEEFLALIIAK